MRRPGLEFQLAGLCLLPGGIAGAALAFEYVSHHSRSPVFWPLLGGLAAACLVTALVVIYKVRHAFGTLINLLGSLREGEYAIYGRIRSPGSPFDAVLAEINGLTAILKEQRLGEQGALLLLDRVIREIDAAVIVFDQHRIIQRTNPAAQRMFGQNKSVLEGKSAGALGLTEFLKEEGRRLVTHDFAGETGRWEISCRRFKEKGLVYTLLMVGNLSAVLREEERRAWKKLIRVLGHELNNGLAAIHSTADTLHGWAAHPRGEPLPNEDLLSGLSEIINQSADLSRFLNGYTRLAKLPPPEMCSLDLPSLIRRLVKLFPDVEIDIQAPETLETKADEGQLMQAGLNLLKNAVEATTLREGRVEIRLTGNRETATVQIIDEGEGIQNPDNLFTPFYTTKPKGAGIGLLLSREIIEAHGGTLELKNRENAKGCIASITLPRNTKSRSLESHDEA
ncbi:PAS domain S-box protein [Sulfidibacter corallicola]|uniref:histidine kinase n=1 Tax=Sulfidibacter corallicola TaxID=2818388 RepID=A0A8A4THY7_SULCO|nr:ATP-binding protein [Sulfidibacter corallicola]QTD49107.1 PAS domain S-box protein [Sulfidibacter corallicola]